MKRIRIDTKDLEILKLIEDDAKLSYQKIANKTHMKLTTVYDRIKKLEDNKIILGYKTIINKSKLEHMRKLLK